MHTTQLLTHHRAPLSLFISLLLSLSLSLSACAVVRACYSASRHLMMVYAFRRTVMHEMEKQVFGKGFRF